MTERPPLAISCSRPIAWAATGSPVRLTGRMNLFVDGKRVGRVPYLVIAKYKGEEEVLVLHCDEDWSSVAVSGGFGTVSEAKRRVEKWYEGISDRWVETGFTESQTETHLDEVFSEDVCTFCAMRPDQVPYLYGTGRGKICGDCILKFHKMLEQQMETGGDS